MHTCSFAPLDMDEQSWISGRDSGLDSGLDYEAALASYGQSARQPSPGRIKLQEYPNA